MTTYARPKDIPDSFCVSGTIVTLANGKSYKRYGKKWIILCEHGKKRNICIECGGTSMCPHKKQHQHCKDCGHSSACEHGRQHSDCKDCDGVGICEHGIRRSTCRKCDGSRFCEHNKVKRYCRDCNGSGLCHHNKNRYLCIDCGGSGICGHGKYRQNCVECGGSQTCEHKKQRRNCVECNGAGICEHKKYRNNCGECGPRRCKAHDVTKCGTLAKYEKYEGYCLRCFIHLFPDKPVTRNYKVKEQYVTDAIMALLDAHKIVVPVPVSLDKPVGGCSSKRPDLFIELLTHAVIVEVDEDQHRSKEYTSCDSAREVILFHDVAERPCVFLRFNPDAYTDKDNKKHKSCFKYNRNGICVLGDKKEFERRIDELFTQVRYHIEVVPEKSITKEYLYYDQM